MKGHMSPQVPGILLPHGHGVLLCCNTAFQTGAVRDEGSDPDMEGAGRGLSGSQQIQGQPAGHDHHWLDQRSEMCIFCTKHKVLLRCMTQCCQVCLFT